MTDTQSAVSRAAEDLIDVPAGRPRRFAGFGDRFADYGIAIATALLFAVLSFANDAFLTRTNLLNILDQQAALGIIACGVTLCIIAGGFDLSVAAVYAIAAVAAAKVAIVTGNPIVGLGAAVVTGLLLGAVNGLLVTIGRIQSFIATLATSIVIRGLALAITGGFVLGVTDSGFSAIGEYQFLGLPASGLLFLVFAALCWFALARTVFGRYLYAVGGNPEAARLSGIRVNLVRFATFAICGLGAGLAGMIDVSRVSSAQAGIGVGLELTAIAAVVIGGTSIAGGEGAIWRTLLGVLFLALVNNGFNLLGVNPIYQQMFQGGLIVLAIGLDAWTRRRRT